MQKKKSRPARAETRKKVAQTVGDSLNVDPTIWLMDEPSMWFVGGRGYQGLTNTPAIVQRAKEAYPHIYCKIVAATDLNNPRLKSIAEVIITELRESAPNDRLKAINLVYEAATVIRGNQFTTVRQNPAERSTVPLADQETILELLRDSMHDPDVEVCRAAARALSPFADDWAVRVCEIAAEVGVNNEDSETAIAAMCLIDQVGVDVASLALPALCRAAQSHNDAEVRIWACNMLRDLGEESREAFPILMELAAADASQAVRLVAVRAILQVSKIDSFDLATVVEELKKAPDLPKLISDLAAGGKEFRELRKKLQNQPKSGASDPSGSGGNREAAPGDEPSGEGAGEKNEADDTPLGERARLVLTVLLDAMAFDSDHRQSTEDIATNAVGKTTSGNQFKSVIVNLKSHGLIDTREGRGGGCWLTPLGRLRAENLKL